MIDVYFYFFGSFCFLYFGGKQIVQPISTIILKILQLTHNLFDIDVYKRQPEGKSIIELGRESGLRMRNLNTDGAHMIKFTAETKCSGINLKDGTEIRKGAFDAIRKIALSAGNPFPKETEDIIQTLTSNGGTPLVVSVNKKIAGVIAVSYTHLSSA